MCALLHATAVFRFEGIPNKCLRCDAVDHNQTLHELSILDVGDVRPA